MLWLDGVYESAEQPHRKPRLRRARAPTFAQLTQLAESIAHRVRQQLARRSWLESEEECVSLTDSAGGNAGMDTLRMSSITYRIATGKHAGHPARAVPPDRAIHPAAFCLPADQS